MAVPADTREARVALTVAPVAMELVCVHLSALDKSQLRQVCRSFCEAMCNCFTTVRLSPRNGASPQDILEMFPRTVSLYIDCRDDDDDSRLEGAIDRLAACSPKLLGKLQTCHLKSNTWNPAAVQALASRCASLNDLTFEHHNLKATFRGCGGTASEQRAHLQQMLATPATTPTLLFPPSWAARHCLRELFLNLPNPDDYSRNAQSLFQPLNAFSNQPHSALLACTLAHLAALTRLEVRFREHEEAYILALQAVSQLPQLRHLKLTNEEEHDLTPDDAETWANLSPLTSLTHLHISMVDVDLAALTSLRNLQHLDVDYWVVDVTHLYALTALTYLSLGDENMGDGELQHEQSPLTRGLPGAWCTGLKYLAWMHNSNIDPAVLGMLRSLTHLGINYQEFTIDFVRTLAELPHLQRLDVADMTPHASLRTCPGPPPISERPVLKCLRRITDRYGEMAFINVLASWSRLPAGAQPVRISVGEAFDLDPVAQVQHWSPCWLRALLRADEGRQQRLLFLTEQDVTAFCEAAEGLAGAITVPMVLHVAPQLPPAVFQQLMLTAGRLAERDWVLDGWGTLLETSVTAPYEAVPDLSYVGVDAMPAQGLRLTAAHVQGLPAGSLPTLSKVRVGQVSPAAKRGLLAAAPAACIVKANKR